MTGSPPPDDGRPRRVVPNDGDERTTLAWDRTALALLVVAAGTARHTWSLLGPAALLPLIPLVLLSIWVTSEGWRRYDDDRTYRVYRAIGGPTLVLASTTALVAVIEAVHLLAA